MIDLPPQLILAEDDPLVKKTKIDIQDLVDKPMILLDLPLSSTYFLSLFQELGLRPQVFERVSISPACVASLQTALVMAC